MATPTTTSAPRPARRTRLAPDERRERILAAARHVFARTPYADVTLATVANEAGVSRSLVAHYFGGKADLFGAVMRAMAEAAPEAVRTDRDLPLERTVEANVDDWLEFAERHGELSVAFAGIGPLGRSPELQALVTELRERVVDRMLVNHLGTTDVPRAVRVALRAYTGLYEVAVAEWLHAGRMTREEVRVVITRGLYAVLEDVVPALLDAEPSS
jgi:AcrR family transcriptional regulator